ncbi:MAG: nucleotidyltransferase family protein [Pseudomonadales bacterium]|jgi:MurNAc alpha-1-phosphate uridylyltransferase|nr:nucleotidyltransferase family protein [Pseudomonadales bacterium]
MNVETAMILAAGRGERLRPLTDRVPKPLVPLAGRTLVDHHLERLAAIGIRRVVVNLHHLGEQIREHVLAHSPPRLTVHFSEEPELLETAGGIRSALPLLGDAPFLVVNGDVFSDFDLARLLSGPGPSLAHLVMVPAPPWVTHGDFDLAREPARAEARAPLALGAAARLTYAGIGVYDPAFFAGMEAGVLPLRPLLDAAIAAGRVSGEVHRGIWEDIGTPERLARAQARHGP